MFCKGAHVNDTPNNKKEVVTNTNGSRSSNKHKMKVEKPMDFASPTGIYDKVLIICYELICKTHQYVEIHNTLDKKTVHKDFSVENLKRKKTTGTELHYA